LKARGFETGSPETAKGFATSKIFIISGAEFGGSCDRVLRLKAFALRLRPIGWIRWHRGEVLLGFIDHFCNKC
jgi:hypothetical protein